MPSHKHQFVDNYRGLIGFGLNRETDEKTLMVYLQKFADDRLAGLMVQRMSDGQLESLFNCLTELMREHLSEEEYHTLFLHESG